jgi:hypothetical protein
MAGLPDSGNVAVDRMTVDAEQNLQDLQDFGRRTQKDVATLQDVVDAIQATVAAIRPGRLLATSGLVTGTSSGTLPAGTCVVILTGTGGGGGGGGAAGALSAGGGGSAGVRARYIIGTPGTPLASLAISWAAGAAGAAGTSAPGAGGTGGDSTFTVNGVTYTFKGGTGGALMGASANNVAPGGQPQAGSTAGAVPGYCGDPGQNGMVWGGVANFSGGGGAHEFGIGGAPVGGTNPGNAASGHGCGGGGAASGGAGQAGGAGTDGAFTWEAFS